MNQETSISNAEMVVMRVIWSLGEAKVTEVANQVSKRQNWSLATVKTLLGRLVKKQMLSTEKEGRAFIYKPLASEEETLQLLTEDLLNKICATKKFAVIEEAIRQTEMTEADVKQLIQLLENKKTVEQVTCSCLDDMEDCHCQHEH